MNIPELLALATLIKNETGVDKNTATRVGTLFDEIIKKITEGGGGGEGSGVQVITIDALSDLDLLPQGVYLINGAAEGLLVVIETSENQTFSITYLQPVELINTNPRKKIYTWVMLVDPIGGRGMYTHIIPSILSINGVSISDSNIVPLSSQEISELSVEECNQYITDAENKIINNRSIFFPQYSTVTVFFDNALANI